MVKFILFKAAFYYKRTPAFESEGPGLADFCLSPRAEIDPKRPSGVYETGAIQF
ncbi:hypothetical protein [Pseudomonas sp. MWU12-2345]|uniref:hypothetical protein n=1 Tax=Pseudomonas sp. MWU12-2345 TaxID=2928689 RepID=UPI00200D29D3|nr:hypothetical protein [Pseudomonas sp. MWU12-2345]